MKSSFWSVSYYVFSGVFGVLSIIDAWSNGPKQGELLILCVACSIMAKLIDIERGRAK
jgi:hypothetical protein